MPTNFDTLPFDILFGIISHLSLEDVVRVGKTCRQLSSILKEPTLCRKAVEVFHFPVIPNFDHVLIITSLRHRQTIPLKHGGQSLAS